MLTSFKNYHGEWVGRGKGKGRRKQIGERGGEEGRGHIKDMLRNSLNYGATNTDTKTTLRLQAKWYSNSLNCALYWLKQLISPKLNSLPVLSLADVRSFTFVLSRVLAK